jgi:hypothetical protein
MPDPGRGCPLPTIALPQLNAVLSEDCAVAQNNRAVAQGCDMKRILWSAFSVAILGVATLAAGAPTAIGAVEPAFCTSAGPISAQQIPPNLSLNTCPIEGRLIVVELPDGSQGPGLYVPPVGFSTGADELTTSGEYTLVVSNFQETLNVAVSIPATASTSEAGESVVPDAPDPACNESAFNFEGPLWNQAVGTDAWKYNESTASRAGLTVATTEQDIRTALFNLTQGVNNCGLVEGGFNATGRFQGGTTLFANIDNTSHCTSKFPDGQNTVSWGPFDSAHASTLAFTCFQWHTNNGTEEMTEADTYIGSNRGIVDSFPSGCSNSYDLQSIMVHEWGHAFGLAHESAGPDEVMYPTKSPCANRRHLGEGDYIGMASLYP